MFSSMKIARLVRRALDDRERYERLAEQVVAACDGRSRVRVRLPLRTYRFDSVEVLAPALDPGEVARATLEAVNRALDAADAAWEEPEEENDGDSGGPKGTMSLRSAPTEDGARPPNGPDFGGIAGTIVPFDGSAWSTAPSGAANHIGAVWGIFHTPPSPPSHGVGHGQSTSKYTT